MYVTKNHEADDNVGPSDTRHLTLCCAICSSSFGAWVPMGSEFASLFSTAVSHSFSGSKAS